MFERLGTLEETVSRHANFLLDERVSELAVDMRQHPESYPRYHQANQATAQAEQALRAVLGDKQHLLTALIEAITVRDGIEYEDIYKLGYMDGGRMYHAFVTHTLPASYAQEKGESS